MNDRYPLVSFCMPAYNAGHYVVDTVESILSQSYQNWELIIVNDGSTDHTAHQLSHFKDHRITVIEQANMGQCNAANKAFSLSKGTYIKFIDADDLISSNFIEDQVKLLSGKKNTIATSAWGRFYNYDLTTFRLEDKKVEKDLAPIDWLVTSMNMGEVMLQCGLWLIPRDILDKSGLWDETLSLINDFEFFIRVLLQAEIITLSSSSILYYRSHVKNSLSGLRSKKGAESAFNSINKATALMLDFEGSIRVKKVAANCLQYFVYSFYPEQMDLVILAEERIDALGGSTVGFPAGGYTKFFAGMIGWKLTKQIKRLFIH